VVDQPDAVDPGRFIGRPGGSLKPIHSMGRFAQLAKAQFMAVDA
jgi:hypothetical protein